MNGTNGAQSGLELLVFELGSVRLALELTVVREVVRAVLVTPLPGAPPVVEGVIDVRGELAPVYDLRQRFGLPPAPLHPDERLVLAWTGERLVAIRCDHTDWIETADPESVERAEPLVQDGRRMVGIVRVAGGLALIYDLASFLDHEERTSLEAALAAREAQGT